MSKFRLVIGSFVRKFLIYTILYPRAYITSFAVKYIIIPWHAIINDEFNVSSFIEKYYTVPDRKLALRIANVVDKIQGCDDNVSYLLSLWEDENV